ncbi:MAG TPA: helix-turn-helix transcriptional regulator [Solirubrobacteraceae bacterium]
MSRRLTSTSYAFLALVGEGGAAPYDLVDILRRGGRLYWTTAASHVYAEPKRLAGMGLLQSHKEPGRTHERTVYELTDAGREVLLDYLRRPARFPRIQHEAALRVLAGEQLGAEAVLASLEGLAADIEELSGLLDETQPQLEAMPEPKRIYRRLGQSLARRLVAAHEEWLAEVRATLQAG